MSETPKDDFTASDAFGLVRSFTRHVQFVREGIGFVTAEMERRATVHDASKMSDEEFAGFARINAAARINKFGSPEYSEAMDRERPTIDLHFKRNSHHPERAKLLADEHPDAADDFHYWTERNRHAMTFLDVIEMVCDWWGARKGYDDPRPWAASVQLNLTNKAPHLSDHQRWLAQQVAAFLATKESP